MLGRTTRLAPAVVGALITGLGIDCAAVRAEPAAPAAASAAADDCLASPNRTSPAGTHWYYRIDRNGGRHCWYLRPTIEGHAHQQSGAGERAVAPHSVAAPAPRPPARAAVERPAAPAEAAAPPAPMISAPSALPSSNWPMPAPLTPSLSSATASASATDSSAADQSPPPAEADAKIDTPPAPDPAPPPMPRIAPKPPAEQPRPHATEFEHIPALLGTGLVLVLILVGSLAFRIAARVLRRPRRHALQEAAVSRWDAYADAPLAPQIADGRSDITDVRPDNAPPLRPDDWVSDDMPEPHEAIAKPRVSSRAEPATGQGLFDADVRELLRRLPTALAKGPGRPIRVERDRAPSADNHVPAPPLVPGDLNAALASWQGRRR